MAYARFLDVNMAGLGATKPAHDMVVTIVNEFAAVARQRKTST